MFDEILRQRISSDKCKSKRMQVLKHVSKCFYLIQIEIKKRYTGRLCLLFTTDLQTMYMPSYLLE
jgi:hypothetical protein